MVRGITGLVIAAASLVAVNMAGNSIYDPISSNIVGNLLGMVVDSLYDCKSEGIGPGFLRFKAEIVSGSSKVSDDNALLNVMATYGLDMAEALGSEVDRLESEIQKIVPGIRYVDRGT